MLVALLLEHRMHRNTLSSIVQRIVFQGICKKKVNVLEWLTSFLEIVLDWFSVYTILHKEWMATE